MFSLGSSLVGKKTIIVPSSIEEIVDRWINLCTFKIILGPTHCYRSLDFVYTCEKYHFEWNFKMSLRTTKPTKWCVCPADSDQPGRSPSLIRVFGVHLKKGWILSYPRRAQRRLWSDWVDAQADLSLLGAQIILLVSSCTGSNVICQNSLKYY